MKQIFFLSGEHVELAKGEVLALLKNTSHRQIGRILIAENNKIGLNARLAYTHAVFDFLFETTHERLLKKISEFHWSGIYKTDFCIRIINLLGDNKFKEHELARPIWAALKKPKVNLTNPATEITFFILGKRIVCGVLRSKISKDFKDRRPHLRPILHPTSMHPKLARVCINLTGIENKKDKIADLLCGSAGILIEMGLMGFSPLGVDNDKNMLWRAKVNLDYYKIKDYKLANADATKFRQKLDYAVSDFPYGKNTRKAEKVELERFYLSFLVNLRKILRKKAVLVFPSFSGNKKLIRKAGFFLEKEFTVYIHGSLSRNVCVICPRS